MPIALEDGFLQTHDLAHVGCLGIQTNRLQACVERIKERHVKGVFGSPDFGFEGTDVDFLSELPWVEAIWFWNIRLKSVEGLHALKGLRHFGMHPKRPPIDFSSFPRLQKVVTEPHARDCGIEDLDELKTLIIGRYQPKDKTFSAIALPRSLVELGINWANPGSLESLPAHPELRRLEIHRCRNLHDLGDLGRKYPNLEHLVIGACGRLSRDEGERVVRDLPRLSHAYVQDARLV